MLRNLTLSCLTILLLRSVSVSAQEPACTADNVTPLQHAIREGINKKRVKDGAYKDPMTLVTELSQIAINKMKPANWKQKCTGTPENAELYIWKDPTPECCPQQDSASDFRECIKRTQFGGIGDPNVYIMANASVPQPITVDNAEAMMDHILSTFPRFARILNDDLNHRGMGFATQGNDIVLVSTTLTPLVGYTNCSLTAPTVPPTSTQAGASTQPGATTTAPGGTSPSFATYVHISTLTCVLVAIVSAQYFH